MKHRLPPKSEAAYLVLCFFLQGKKHKNLSYFFEGYSGMLPTIRFLKFSDRTGPWVFVELLSVLWSMCLAISSRVLAASCSSGPITIILLIQQTRLYSAQCTIKISLGTLLVQWLRICLPMQGTQVWSLLWEDLTCLWVTKPVFHNYWIYTLEPMSHNRWAYMPQLLKPMSLEPVFHDKRVTLAFCN